MTKVLSNGRVGPPQPHMFVFVLVSYTFVFVSWQKSCPMAEWVLHSLTYLFLYLWVTPSFVFVSWHKSCPIGRVGPPLQGGAVSLSFSFACHHITQKGTQHLCLLNKLDATIFWLMLKYWSSGVSKNHTKASILQISHFNCEAHDLLYERSQGHEKTSLFSQKKSNFGRTWLRISRTKIVVLV